VQLVRSERQPIGASPLGPIWKAVETHSLPRRRGHSGSRHRSHDAHCRDAWVISRNSTYAGMRVAAAQVNMRLVIQGNL
jgi:hypothetical protein